MRVRAYTVCWNEIKILPYYLKHYSTFCEDIVIYDNGSTDGSRDLIKSHPKTILRHFESHDQLRDDIQQEIKNNCWKETRLIMDWVIVSDVDELLYCDNLEKFITDNAGYSVFTPIGYNMVSDYFPKTNNQIYDEIKYGCYHPPSCKPVLFNPNRVIEINYSPGAHYTKNEIIVGNMWHWYDHHAMNHAYPIKLLHFKFLGLNYVIDRYKALEKRISSINKENNWGMHYTKSASQICDEFQLIKNASFKVL